MQKEIDYGYRMPGDLMSIGDAPEDFVLRPLAEQVYLAARSHLCPVPDEVVKSYSEQFAKLYRETRDKLLIREGGMRMAVNRYMECNFALKHVILESAKKHNPLLYKRLMAPVAREPGEMPEPDLKKKYLPKDFSKKMALASTLYGYALPRILLVQYGENRNNRDQRTQERILRGMEAVDSLVERYTHPMMLTVKLGEEVARMDADARRVIYHMLSASLLKEEGCKKMFRRAFNIMNNYAPMLRYTYNNLIRERGIDGVMAMGIVVPDDLE